MVDCDAPICDFCTFYAFNGDEHGAYTGDGRCEHPDHPRPSEPDGGCDDFNCEFCTPTPPASSEETGRTG